MEIEDKTMDEDTPIEEMYHEGTVIKQNGNFFLVVTIDGKYNLVNLRTGVGLSDTGFNNVHSLLSYMYHFRRVSAKVVVSD